ncbi:MAG: CPBP family intramembrane metalloprotease [Chitinophagaceae bacterium]|nr:CPBP family intramembrane metalloprotease [Chitinophagaceae bacterium]
MKDIKDNIQILVITTAINLIVLWNYISKGEIKHGIGYFVFFYVAIFIIHIFTKRVPPTHEIEVKNPRMEFFIATLFSIFGLLFLALNFMQKSGVIPKNILTMVPINSGVFLFSMPLGILIYLLLKKYKLMQLGITIKPLIYLLLATFVYGLTGLFAFIFNEEGIIWKEGLEELGGVVGIVVQSIIGAALVEEFSRFVIQSRFEKLYNASGLGILFASTLWAFMHFPVAYFKGSNISNTIIYCIQIIPIGFIWGYLTHRTKSIIPSTIVHGLNLWGFQN